MLMESAFIVVLALGLFLATVLLERRQTLGRGETRGTHTAGRRLR